MSQKKVNIDVNTIDLDNSEFQKALQIIQFTNNSLFLTGKAGTGKSTFLRYIAATTKKKHIILAPTGIAAINAGGSTLHSLFADPLAVAYAASYSASVLGSFVGVATES